MLTLCEGERLWYLEFSDRRGRLNVMVRMIAVPQSHGCLDLVPSW